MVWVQSQAEQRDESLHRDGVPPALVAAAGWCWRILVIAAAITALGMLARKLELVVIPLCTALLLSALLHPVNGRLRRAGVPRGLAALITVLIALATLGGIGAYVVNRASAEYADLVDQLGVLVGNTQHYLITGPLKLNPNQVNNAGDQVLGLLDHRQGAVASGVVSATRRALDVVTDVVLTFFLTIFMLYDGDRIWTWLAGLFPERNRHKVDDVGAHMWTTLSGYVTGTFTVATFHAVVIGITLAILHVPLVAPIAVLIFIGSFIPLIGAVIFGGVAVLIALVTTGPTAAIVVLVVLLVDNQIESHVLQPFVVGRYVRLHPMAMALTLAAGAVIAGLPGAIFSVPLIASVNAAVKVLTGRDTMPAVHESAAGEEAAASIAATATMDREDREDRDEREELDEREASEASASSAGSGAG